MKPAVDGGPPPRVGIGRKPTVDGGEGGRLIFGVARPRPAGDAK